MSSKEEKEEEVKQLPLDVKIIKELEEEINEDIDYEDMDITEAEIEDKKAYS